MSSSCSFVFFRILNRIHRLRVKWVESYFGTFGAAGVGGTDHQRLRSERLRPGYTMIVNERGTRFSGASACRASSGRYLLAPEQQHVC
jgi:hypothetical protein